MWYRVFGHWEKSYFNTRKNTIFLRVKISFEKSKYTWMLGNMKFLVLNREISCSTIEINSTFPHIHLFPNSRSNRSLTSSIPVWSSGIFQVYLQKIKYQYKYFSQNYWHTSSSVMLPFFSSSFEANLSARATMSLACKNFQSSPCQNRNILVPCLTS